jgi:glycosyltransferase involved in cell wall biosynthesis
MFETTKIPPYWTRIINDEFDRLIVPSKFCSDVFASCGVNRPISIVPLGVNTDVWRFKNRETLIGPFKFILFANAGWQNVRKNYQLTLNAFARAFKENDNVQLILKVTGSTKGLPKLPRNVKVINKRMTQRELCELLHSCHCLVFPSTGEGYGLPPREAMCTGMPVITTNWSSLTDICDTGLVYSIDPCGMQKARLGDFSITGKVDIGKHAIISSDDLSDKMLHVYQNRSQAFTKGKLAARYIREHETTDIAVAKLCEIFGIEPE